MLAKKAKMNSSMINCRQLEFPRQRAKEKNQEDWMKQREPWNTRATTREKRKKSKRIDKSINHVGFLVLLSSFQSNRKCLHGVWACVRKLYFSPFFHSRRSSSYALKMNNSLSCNFSWALDMAKHFCAREAGKRSNSFTFKAYYHVTLSLGP